MPNVELKVFRISVELITFDQAEVSFESCVLKVFLLRSLVTPYMYLKFFTGTQSKFC